MTMHLPAFRSTTHCEAKHHTPIHTALLPNDCHMSIPSLLGYIEVLHEHSGVVVGVVNYSRTFEISPVGLTGENIAKGSLPAIG